MLQIPPSILRLYQYPIPTQINGFRLSPIIAIIALSPIIATITAIIARLLYFSLMMVR